MLKASLVAGASAALISNDVIAQFNTFTAEHGIEYDTQAEWGHRLGVFAENIVRIEAHNERHVAEGGERVFGVNKFSDLTPEEFKAGFLTYVPSENPVPDEEREIPSVEAPLASIDWRSKGVVTPVKDQGRCGSCWAFSATEAIESYAKMSGKYSLIQLSPQQINSCDRNDGGCNGGNTETAYRYVKSVGGLERESDYPYTSGSTGRTGSCQFQASKIAVKITGYVAVRSGESNLQSALNKGPVSVCLAAESFQYYNSGILKSCAPPVDHCVQAVGYNSGYSTPYWIVRNSWGTSWGEKGYIRIMMGKDLCSISDDVTYPTF